MKGGAENRKKTIALGVLAAGALCGVLYNLYSAFGGPNTPPSSVAPVAAPAVRQTLVTSRTGAANIESSGTRATSGAGANGSAPAIPGVAAQKVASTSASLDPTLDQTAMLRTEGLVYSGSGRNIFSSTYTAPVIALPRNVPPPRPSMQPVAAPSIPSGPPPPPPIPLKFFGTAQRARGAKQAFLLSGEDVYLALPGDIVAKRYRVDQITPYGIQMTDLTNNNSQTLPLQQQ